jgi:protein-disulfide isomerase
MSEITENNSPEVTPEESESNVLTGLRNSGHSLLLTILLLTVFFAVGLGTGYLVWGQPLATMSERVESLQARAEAAESLLQEIGFGVQNPAPAEVDPDAPLQVVRYPVTEDGNPSFGPDDAPITIIEFSDYECPYCESWHTIVWPQLLAHYPNEIRLVYRDFPLYSLHANAAPAAEAAYCAQEQDNYWDFHTLLFSGGQGLNRETYLSYATNLGLDIDLFSTCLDEKRYASNVEANFEYARQLGVQSTPTFFINGIALIGAQPFEVFQEIIDLELAGKLSK